MKKEINQIYFPANYIEIKGDDFYVVVNPSTCRSKKMDSDEYKRFNEFCQFYKQTEQNKTESPFEVEYILSLVMAGLIALKPYNISIADNTSPYSVYWGLTENCNFRCVYCYMESDSCVKMERESALTMDEYKHAIDKIHKYGYKELVLTGGEPLLNKNVFSIAEYASQKGMICGLLTNGSLVTKYPIDLYKSFRYVKISLDSSKPETQDILRGKGTFHQIIKGIKYLVDHGVNVDINTVITKMNKDELEDLIAFTYQDLKIRRHTLSLHMSIGRGQTDALSCNSEEIENCDKMIFRSKYKYSEKDMLTLLQDTVDGRNATVSCGMGYHEIFINSIGDVFPCRLITEDQYYMGNIIRDDMETIINRAVELRGDLHVEKIEGCHNCTYKYICGGGCRALHRSYSGSLEMNDPTVCQMYKRQYDTVFLKRYSKEQIYKR